MECLFYILLSVHILRYQNQSNSILCKHGLYSRRIVIPSYYYDYLWMILVILYLRLEKKWTLGVLTLYWFQNIYLCINCYSLSLSYSELQNIRILITSVQYIDNWPNPYLRATRGDKSSDIGNIVVYFPLVFCVRSVFIRYIFTNLFMEVNGVIVGLD